MKMQNEQVLLYKAKYLNKERSDDATKKILDKFSFFGTLINKTSQITRVMLRLYFQTKLIIYRRAQIFIRAIRGGGGLFLCNALFTRTRAFTRVNV